MAIFYMDLGWLNLRNSAGLVAVVSLESPDLFDPCPDIPLPSSYWIVGSFDSKQARSFTQQAKRSNNFIQGFQSRVFFPFADWRSRTWLFNDRSSTFVFGFGDVTVAIGNRGSHCGRGRP